MPLRCRPTLEMIRANVELEARLIDDLLDVSRIARGQMTYRFETVDVHAVIRAGRGDLPGRDRAARATGSTWTSRPPSTTSGATRPACSRSSGT